MHRSLICLGKSHGGFYQTKSRHWNIWVSFSNVDKKNIEVVRRIHQILQFIINLLSNGVTMIFTLENPRTSSILYYSSILWSILHDQAIQVNVLHNFSFSHLSIFVYTSSALTLSISFRPIFSIAVAGFFPAVIFLAVRYLSIRMCFRVNLD